MNILNINIPEGTSNILKKKLPEANIESFEGNFQNYESTTKFDIINAEYSDNIIEVIP